MLERAAAFEPSHIPPQAVRVNDVRGRAGSEITAAGVRSLGLSFAAEARAHGLSRIGVLRDGRLSSPELEQALVEGLVAGGMQVARLGLGPTPMLAFAVRRLQLDGGVMVTASHNPPDENGLKLLLGHERVHGEALAALVRRVGRPTPGGRAAQADILETYVAALAAAAAEARPLAVAWDCGNGATGPAVERLTARLPGRHVLVNAAVDGGFPNHHPDPAIPANLVQLGEAVRAHGCDLGVAFDGDGDRIGVIDATGEPLPSDLLLLFLAADLLRGHPGAAIVGDVKCSRLLFDGIAQLGGRPLIAPSGYVLIREALRREGALLGGELSGHMFFADRWRGVDDALYAAVRTLTALSRAGVSLREFRAALPPTFVTPEVRLACHGAEAKVAAVARRLAPDTAFDTAMGLRRATGDGWWLLRASATEAKVTCRCEAATAEGLRAVQTEASDALVACGLAPPDDWPQPTRAGSASSDSASR